MKRPGMLSSYCCALYGFLYIPLAVMVAFSFNDARRNVAWKGFTLKWYGQLVHNGDLLGSLGTTVQIALVASLIATVLGLLSSYAMTRHPAFRGRQAYAGLMNVPLMMPEIVMGVGLLSFFVRASIPLNFWSLSFAHAVIALPYSASSLRARLLSLKDARLEDAAQDLGATEWQSFMKITLPLARPALVSGALLAFTVSFEDFVTSFFIAGIGITTMPIQIYSMMKFGISPEMNALATCLLALTAVALLVQHRLAPEESQQR